MPQLTPIQVDENTIIYIEATENTIAPAPISPSPAEPTRTFNPEVQRGYLVDQKGIAEEAAQKAAQSFQALEGTIRSYTRRTLNAFTNMGLANVDKVTLEFGINIAGEAGVPYVTKGTAECSLKITVECSFPKD